jgi:predicted DNA-binding protein with PD1-like motif
VRVALIALAAARLAACAPLPAPPAPPAAPSVAADTRALVIRLKPGMDVKAELERLAGAEHLQAASIVSVVGSLTDVALRYANQPTTTTLTGHFEVVAMSGYLAAGEFHCHLAVSDGDGRTVGGHLMDGNRVYTTLVVVIEEHLRYRYRRAFDASTGRDELVIEPR